MRTIALTSGKGGVGKTSISINIAIALTRMGKRVALFDADLQLANIDVMVGCHSEYNLQHVLNGEKTLREIMTPGPAGISLVTGGSGVSQLIHAGPKRMATFFSQIDELEEDFEFLIYDTAAGLDNRVFAFLKRADETLVVATPDATSITDAYALIKVLYRREPDAIVRVIVNRVRNEQEARSVFRVIKNTAHEYLDTDILYGGSIRYDAAFDDSMRERRALLEAFPNAKCAADFETVARELCIPVYRNTSAA
ncbi:MAG: MinD/ParA family protein [Armatimonadetes bacterium]|nr:MinD/ParA family protein [Armatimonadota bacterium]